jgi:lipoprotein-anchoring transpeptidase ErfK/SrfK
LDALLLGGIVAALVGACLVLVLMAWQAPEVVRAFYQPTRTRVDQRLVIARQTQVIQRTQVVLPTQVAQRPETVRALPTSTPLPVLEPVYTPTSTATATPAPTATSTSTPQPTPTASRVVPNASTSSNLQGVKSAGQTQQKWIDIDLSEQRLTAYEGEDIVLSVLVSTGLPHTPTPIGEFRIRFRVRVQEMGGDDYSLPNVEYVSYFFKDYAMHGTYWHNNFGQPMSHGCVNLRTPDAQWIYNWAPLGTPVRVHD